MVSQPVGIALNNSHLLRAALVFAVLGVIGPGLFQLRPPQWLGAPEIDVASAAIPVSKAVSSSKIVGAVTDSERAEDARAVPPVPAAAPKTATIPKSVVEAGQPAMPAESVLRDRPAADGAIKPAPAGSTDTAEVEADRPVQAESQPAAPVSIADAPENAAARTLAPPEQPAVLARKTKKPAAPATTQVASVSPRVSVPPPAAKKPAGPIVVPREFAKRIPEAHLALPVKSQKESFVAMTLPLILAANEEISQRRSAIKRVAASGNRAGLERWAKLYKVKTEGRSRAEIEKQLLLRADFVPVSLALAQAAIESGWGTSRFALQGNALFGQWAWQKDAGLKPAQASNANAVVRSFPNLFGSVRAYMHNLNTHPRYAAFRARRHLLRGRSEADLGYQLSNFMDGYAEIGDLYVGKLKTLIRSNNFGRYEMARLS